MYLSAYSTYVRIGFRIVFFVLSVYLGAVGSYCNKLSLKLRLLHDGRVPVQEAAGWVQGTAIFEPLYRTRRIPSWRWWTIMAAVLVLVKINDLITNTIGTVEVMSQCAFGEGMVLSENGFDTFFIPPSNSRSQLVAGNAQLASLENGCLQGIYKKVNNDLTFCATDNDIIGYWDCKPIGNNITYPYGTSMDAVASDLGTRNLLYGGYYSEMHTSNTENSAMWTHYVLWSSSTSVGLNTSGTVFSVKAVVDTTPLESDRKTMHGMQCHLEGQDQVRKIAAAIPSGSTLSAWVGLLQGFMYEGYNSPIIYNPEGTLAWLLNSMIMVAGGSDTLLNIAPEDDQYQGCRIPQTWVPGFVVAFLVLTVLACAGMTTSTFYYYYRLRSHQDRSQVEYAPVDRWSWMGQAAAETNAVAFGPVYPVKSQELARWNIERDAGATVRLVKAHEEAVLLNTVYPKMDQVPAAPVGPIGVYAREISYPGT